MKLMHLKINNTILQNWKQKSSSRKIQFSTHTVSFSLYHLLQHCSCLNFSMLFIIDRDEMDPIQWGLSLYFYLNRRIFLLVVVVDEKFFLSINIVFAFSIVYRQWDITIHVSKAS